MNKEQLLELVVKQSGQMASRLSAATAFAGLTSELLHDEVTTVRWEMIGKIATAQLELDKLKSLYDCHDLVETINNKELARYAAEEHK